MASDQGATQGDGIDQKIRALYPMLVIYLDHPELGPILRQAAAEGWIPQRLEGAVQGTEWWKATHDHMRQMDHVRETNPGQWDQLLQRKMFDLSRLSITNLGFAASPTDLQGIAEHALLHGTTDQQALKAMQGLARYTDKSESERQFIALALLDPETLNARIRATSADLRMSAHELGVRLTDDQLLDLSTKVFREGFTAEQVRQELVSQVNWEQTDQLQGAAADAFQNVRRIASDYMVNLSDRGMRSWAAAVLGGDGDLSQFTEYAMQQAVSRFPTMQAALERGLTAQDFVEPYRQLVSQFWEMNPEEVDFMGNEKLWGLLDGGRGEKGEARPLTLSESAKWLRSQEQYQKTDTFRSQVAEVSEMLGQTFGKVA